MTIEKLRTEVERATIEMDYETAQEALAVIDRYMEQEQSKNIKEIEEVINCDADAETKCKMISNILTAKPHYFEEQEPTSVKHDTFPVKLRINKVSKHISNIDLDELEQEPCDVVSRQWLMRKATERFYTTNYFNHITKMIEEAPPVRPQELIRCKDCIHNNDCDIQYHAQAGDMFYCGMAERSDKE